MSPREIIGQWLKDNQRLRPMAEYLDPDWQANFADALLKALDEQGMAVVPKPRNTPIEELIGFK
jgi:hypothetical protein